MTELDKFVPEGEPIHPFDLYELINNKMSGWRIDDTLTPSDWKSSPDAEDAADYHRNSHKIGTVHVIDGKKYFETTSITPKTRSIA